MSPVTSPGTCSCVRQHLIHIPPRLSLHRWRKRRDLLVIKSVAYQQRRYYHNPLFVPPCPPICIGIFPAAVAASLTSQFPSIAFVFASPLSHKQFTVVVFCAKCRVVLNVLSESPRTVTKIKLEQWENLTLI